MLDTQDRILTLNPQDSALQQLKSYKAVVNMLVDAMQTTHELLAKAANTSAEPDKILAASTVIVQALAEAARVK